MKSILLAASAAILLCGVPTAYAQSAGPTYSNTIHQSAGDRDSRGYPKYYQAGRESARHHGQVPASRKNMPSTTGAGSGPYYDNSIHQSAGDRDSRGNPKYYQAH
jgi:hypothetical protein